MDTNDYVESLEERVRSLEEQVKSLEQMYISDVSSLIEERNNWRDKANAAERMRESSITNAESRLHQLRHV